MKKFRYLLVLALTFVLIGSLVSLAQAQPRRARERNGKVQFAEDSITIGGGGGGIGIRAQQYLMCGYSSISYNGRGTVTVDGFTEANQIVQSIDLELRLQQYDNGKWTTIYLWGFYGADRDYIEGCKGYSIDKGYFYRVTGRHEVLHYGVWEYGTTCTGGIYCD